MTMNQRKKIFDVEGIIHRELVFKVGIEAVDLEEAIILGKIRAEEGFADEFPQESVVTVLSALERDDE